MELAGLGVRGGGAGVKKPVRYFSNLFLVSSDYSSPIFASSILMVFFSNFIETLFTYKITHPFKVDKAMVFRGLGIFTKLFNHQR